MSFAKVVCSVRTVVRSSRREAVAFAACTAAAIAPLTALFALPVVASIAYAVELGSWQYMHRSAQNAADSAALAAATVNSGGGSSTAQNEARAAAQKFGFVNGSNGATVTSATTACPAGTPLPATCYEAVVTTSFPLSFSRIVGFTGSNGSSQLISARSIARTGGTTPGASTSACVYAFSSLTTNGTPNANLSGCSVISGGPMTCTGQGVHADYALAAGSISGSCAANSPTNNLGNRTIPVDPYATLASNIPATTCGTNPATAGNLSGTLLVYCGNVTLSNNLTLTSPNTVVVIKNGTLDLNNKTLKTASGASATIIFEGNSPPFGDKNMKGTIDIKAPDATSGSVWKGVAIYRKPGGAMVEATLAGSQATWTITGLVYLPKTDVKLAGAVNHSSTGATCFVLVGDTIVVDGNGQILQTTTGCSTAGLTPPSVVLGGTSLREKLVK